MLISGFHSTRKEELMRGGKFVQSVMQSLETDQDKLHETHRGVGVFF